LKIGDNIIEAVQYFLLKNTQISYLTFKTYRFGKSKKKKISSYVSRLLYHRETRTEGVFVLRREDILSRAIEYTDNCLKDGYALALSSKVEIDKEIFHIPMIDFRCSVSNENLLKILEFLYETEEKEGVVLNSGNSYHYLGTKLLTESDWLNFIGKSLLFGKYVDYEWVGHRLMDKFCSLRVSSKKSVNIPRVVAIIKN